MSEKYITIDYTCRHCGHKLEAKHKPNPGFTYEGFPPLLYRHMGGKVLCTTAYEARPYSGWDAGRAFKKAEKAEEEGILETNTCAR